MKKGYGIVLAAIAAAIAIYSIAKFGAATSAGENPAIAEALSVSAQVLAAMAGLVFTVLTLVLNFRAFPIRVLVPRIMASEEISVFAYAFAVTLILDIIGLSVNISRSYLVMAGGCFALTLVLLLNAVYFVLMQLKLEEPLDALAQEFSDTLG